MRVLAIGVHPDDVEYGMGATLAKHISMGDDLFVIVSTDGERETNLEITPDLVREDKKI